MAAGAVAIAAGATFTVQESTWLATHFDVPSNVVGLTLLAVGTSLPELGVTITAARKGLGNILIGNVLGSNIARVTLIVGASAATKPLTVEPSTATHTGPFLLLLSAALLVALKRGSKVTKTEGTALLALYLAFMTWFLAGAPT